MNSLRNTLLSYEYEWTCFSRGYNVIERKRGLTKFSTEQYKKQNKLKRKRKKKSKGKQNEINSKRDIIKKEIRILKKQNEMKEIKGAKNRFGDDCHTSRFYEIATSEIKIFCKFILTLKTLQNTLEV